VTQTTEGLNRLTDVGKTVQAFYAVNPFPAFDITKYQTRDDVRQRASPYVQMLDRQLPHNAKIIDIGCGTGQLVNFLALRENRQITGVDFSAVSLDYARSLKDKFQLDNLTLIQDNVLELSLPSEQFDYVFCNGVLHHTGDARKGFSHVARLAKPGGFVTVGLYNNYGRIVHGTTRWLSTHTGPFNQAIADWGVKQMLNDQYEAFDLEKKRTWWEDQFNHPHETVHSANEVLRWFDEEGLDYSSSLPPIELGADEGRVNMFPRQVTNPRSGWRNATAVMRQLHWIWQLRWTGGYFLMVGKKRGKGGSAAPTTATSGAS
jgi:ubiquinone/menaquinone biosynthesis C-methylase UbiE